MSKSLRLLALASLVLVALSGCAPARTDAVFHAETNPAELSAWGVFDTADGALVLSDGVIPYDLNSPLFTDYAHKLRTLWVPPGAPAVDLNAGGVPDFPVGTVISKTFYYPRTAAEVSDVLKADDPIGRLNPILEDLDQVRLMETRLLVRRDAGWDAVSYVWNEDQSDAALTRIGDAQPLTLADEQGTEQDFTYIVPDINQCSGCHAPNNTTRKIEPLGLRARHLNKDYVHEDGSVNQVAYLQARNVLTEPDTVHEVPANVDWTNNALPLEARARSYLDINCSHCHNPVGPADTSGLDLTREAEPGPALGICKLPIAAGSGTGGRTFSIVPQAPDASILLYRLETMQPGAMMPELGRALHHAEGAALIRRWIAEMEGDCAS